MDGITELAKILRERDNPPVQGVGVGAVVTADPLSVRFNGFVLDARNSVVSGHVVLEDGDSVIVIPSADNVKYYIVGKVG